MSIIKSDKVYNTIEYLDLHNIKIKYNISLVELESILYKNDLCLYNYPLSEIEYIIENNIPVVLVNIENDYRYCEVEL